MNPTFDSTRIILLRHGEIALSRQTFYSQQEVELSEKGIQQSLRIARSLNKLKLEGVISSDLSRCLFMARAIADHCGTRLIKTADLREVDFGEWSGLSWEEIDKRYPGELEARMKDLENYRPPGGESLCDVSARVKRVLKRVLEDFRGKTVALVAHGGVNRVLIAEAIGLRLQHIFCLHQNFACANILDFFPDGYAVLRLLNCECSALSAHLE